MRRRQSWIKIAPANRSARRFHHSDGSPPDLVRRSASGQAILLNPASTPIIHGARSTRRMLPSLAIKTQEKNNQRIVISGDQLTFIQENIWSGRYELTSISDIPVLYVHVKQIMRLTPLYCKIVSHDWLIILIIRGLMALGDTAESSPKRSSQTPLGSAQMLTV